MRRSISIVRGAALALLAVAALCPAASAQQLIVNGGFETGLSSWTVADQAGGSGSWFVQTGTGSPLNGFPVASPPEGTFAAMTDQGGPGSHVLYQDFIVPTGVVVGALGFEHYINNTAGAFLSPDTLDFSGAGNQQARVDIMTTTADPFSVAAGDVLMNIFQTMPGDPAVSGYNPVNADVTALLQAHAGQTLRLRFAEVDNQLFFSYGVDRVGLTVRVQDVPEPGTVAFGLSGSFLGLGLLARRRRLTRR
jgi:hypothetical protein